MVSGMREKLPAVAWGLGALLALAALAQLALVLAAAATNHDWVAPIGLFSIVLVAPLCLTAHTGRATLLIGPAAAAAVIGEQFRLDPYYLPSHQRYIENAPMTFIAVVSALIVLCSLATLRWPRAGAVLVGLLLVPLLLSSFVGGLH